MSKDLTEAISILELLKTKYAGLLVKKQKKLDSIETIINSGTVIVADHYSSNVEEHLTRDIAALNKAYDTRYAAFMTDLDKELKGITLRKVIIGEEDGYDQVGHIYYPSMVNKYQRK
jgi:hypothetical protein